MSVPRESHSPYKSSGHIERGAIPNRPVAPIASHRSAACLQPTTPALPESALLVMQALEHRGFEVWFVGGVVRDALLGHPCNDIDIATNAHWRGVSSACHDAGMNVHETGVAHGTVTVTVPASLLPQIGNEDCQAAPPRAFEITTYRHDGPYDDARHPRDVTYISSIEDDLARRDFTINALAFHPERGIIDPYSGMDDLRDGVIRTVGDPDKRFSEDALRMLRGCRFASQLGFTLDPATYKAMVSHKHLLSKVSAERITHELDALLLGDYAGRALVETVDVLAFVLPELVAMKGCEQRTKYHIYDVLEHTARAVDHAQPLRLNRWAALCHDMGKPASAFYDADGVEHFYGHASLSDSMTKAIMDRLLVSSAFKSRVSALVRYHDVNIDPHPRSVRRLLLRLNGDVDLFRALCDLKKADALAHAPAWRQEGVDAAEALLTTLDTILESDSAFSLSSLAVNGRDIMQLGVQEGPQVGSLLSSLLSDVIDERIPNERQALLDAARQRIGH